MKKLLFSLLLLLTFTALMAQAPQRISYQSIIRDANNVVVASSAVSVKISLLQGTATGPAVYVETHPITTNANGLVSLNIGEGTAITGSFAGIDWSNGPYLIQTATDPTGGTDYSIIGIAPLNSVPYALNAATATKLQAPVTINGIAFDGSSNVTIPATGAVPYTGATQGLDLGAYDLKVNGVTVGRGNGNIPTNTANGVNALAKNTIGYGNTAIGTSALTSNTAGTNNTASGTSALRSNTSGYFNTASGLEALFNNTTGIGNTASGGSALFNNNAGSENTASGAIALYSNTTGSYNTASGIKALYSNRTGANNTAVGYNSLSVNTTGVQNTAIGDRADVESGALTNATAIGAGAKVSASNTIQLGNTSVTNVKTSGTLTAGTVTYPSTHGAANQFLTTTGTGTLTWATPSGGVPYTGATQAVDLGAYDLKVNGVTVGRGSGNIASNTATGYEALARNTTGSFNMASGAGALYRNTEGANNTATGYVSLYSNTTGSDNTATGYIALYANTTGSSNTASGSFALFKNTTGSSNTASGTGALFNNTIGSNNTASGNFTLFSNTEGSANTASGWSALYSNTTGLANMASGYKALYANTSGANNTASGYKALYTNTTGSDNTAIGNGAGVESGALTNTTAIGSFATVLTSNTIQLGNTDVTKVITSGTLTAGAVTYPNVHNTIAGQVLTTNAAGVASWTTPAAELPSSGNTAGDMLFWDGAAWVKVSAGSNGQNLTFYNGAPIWVGALSYSYAGATAYANTVLNPKTGKIWMDRNLGATRVAMSSTDAASYGDLYQWGRWTDGHQIRTSLTTPTQSSLDQPGNVNFILGPDTPYDWRSGQNANLWQGINGVNNPCPSGYRLPTDLELAAELASWSSSDPAGAFASPLKLPVAGRRFHFGPLYPENTTGFYWSSTVSGSLSHVLIFSSGYTTMSTNERANGGAVRCIKN